MTWRVRWGPLSKTSSRSFIVCPVFSSKCSCTMLKNRIQWSGQTWTLWRIIKLCKIWENSKSLSWMQIFHWQGPKRLKTSSQVSAPLLKLKKSLSKMKLFRKKMWPWRDKWQSCNLDSTMVAEQQPKNWLPRKQPKLSKRKNSLRSNLKKPRNSWRWKWIKHQLFRIWRKCCKIRTPR